MPNLVQHCGKSSGIWIDFEGSSGVGGRVGGFVELVSF